MRSISRNKSLGNSMSALSISSIKQRHRRLCGEGLPQHALDDVVVDVLDLAAHPPDRPLR